MTATIIAAAITGGLSLAGIVWVNRRLNRLQARRVTVETTAAEVQYLRDELKETREDVRLARQEAAEATAEAKAARAEAEHVRRTLVEYRTGTLRLIEQLRAVGVVPCWVPRAAEET